MYSKKLKGCQSGMAMRMSTATCQLFNDESIAVQFSFKCLYVELAMDSMEHMINW